MAGRPAGAVCQALTPFSKFTEAGGATTKAIFAVEGARSVTILWKADSGTPTMTVGMYVHPNSTRETTPGNVKLTSVTTGASVAAGQSVVVFPATADFASASDIAIPVQQMDVQVAGNVTNLDVKIIVLY